MAIIAADEMAVLRRRVAESDSSINWDKRTINAALQAAEDKFDLVMTDIGAAIDAATSPFVFSAAQKAKLVSTVLRRKFVREGN